MTHKPASFGSSAGLGGGVFTKPGDSRSVNNIFCVYKITVKKNFTDSNQDNHIALALVSLGTDTIL